MGGKTGTTTQSMQIPPEVMARYNAVNKRAEGVAQQPFQQYSSDPSAFVAQLNQQQQAGISNINQQANAAQPAYQAAMQGTGQAYQGFNAPNFQQGVQGYMSPFLSNAMGATAAQLQNINQQQQQAMKGSAIGQGAFGGDRANIGLSNLINQQNLATGQTLGQMAQQGYQSAAQNYMAGLGQQGQLAAQMGALGAGAQAAGLQGAQAQLGAGTLGQQTEQAGKTALYNQFLQQQAYPFQVAQFLANIAMGTGALSGSTTTTTQPMSFFSDRRLKEDIKRIGETDEGLPIYKFKYKGDPTEQTHVGFMADEVEKVHPEAVGHSHGYKTVDYDKATSEGGAVQQKHAGLGFAAGGYAYDPYDPNSIQNILSAQRNIFENIERHNVPLSRTITGGFGKHSRVPEASLPVSGLRTPGPTPQLPESTLQQGLGAVERAQKLSEIFSKGKEYFDQMKKNWPDQSQSTADVPVPTPRPQEKTDKRVDLGSWYDETQLAANGGRIGYATLGEVQDKEKESTPEGLYSAEQTGKLNIPIDSKNYRMPQQSTLPGAMQDPTMRDLMAIASFASGFRSSGGRAGYEGGGDVNIDPYLGALSKIESSGRYDAIGPTTKSGDRAYGKYQIMGANVPSWTEEALGRKMTPEEFLADKEAQEATARHHFGKFVNQYGSPEDAASVWFSGKPMAKAGNAADILGTTVPAYMQKFRSALAGNEAVSDADLPPQKGAMSSGKAAGLGLGEPQASAAPSEEPKAPAKKGGLGDMMTTENVIPLLVGLGTMASSRSPFLGSAILEGIGGAASAYLPTQQAIKNLEATQAEIEARKVQTGRGRVFQVGNMLYIVGANDQPIPAYDWMGMDPAKRPPVSEFDERRIQEYLKGSGGLGAAAATGAGGTKPDTTIMAGELPAPGEGAPGPLKKYGAEGEGAEPKPGRGLTSVTLSPDALNMVEANRRIAMTSMDEDNNVFGPQDKLGTAGRTQRGILLPLAGAFSRLPTMGVSASGPTQAILKPLTDVMNNLGAVLGKPDLIKDPRVLTDQNEINKLITQLQTQITSSAGQRAYAALQEMADAIPSGLIDKNSQARLMAQIMKTNQREIDKNNYFNDFYSKVAGDRGQFGGFAKYSGKNLDQQFDRDYSRSFYEEEAHNLEKMFKKTIPQMKDDKGNPRTVMDVLTSGTPLNEKQKASIRREFGNQILRYFGIDE